MLKGRWNIFGHFQQRSEVFSEVAGTVMGTLHFYSNPPMDEFPRQTASRKPFSKELTKYEKVDGGEERFIQRVPTKK